MIRNKTKNKMKKIFSTLLVSAVMLSSFSMVAFAEGEPSDVTNIQTVGLNGAVKVTWDEATDDTSVASYQVHYGTEPADDPKENYPNIEDVGNVMEYTVTGLENGTEYFFAVVAIDEDENESINWYPVSGTPEADGGDDTEAPQVSGAEAVNKMQVIVSFSEAVVIPDEDPQNAFTIENDDDLTELIITDAEMNPEDNSGSSVLLTTEAQQEGTQYRLTVNIDVEDLAGNPIISGTSDTAIFDGSAEELPDEDTEGPVVVSLEPMDSTHFIVSFDETILLPVASEDAFTVYEVDDTGVELTVLGAETGQNSDGIEDSVVVVETSEQMDVTYMVEVTTITDVAGNEVQPGEGGEFNGVANDGSEPDPDDTTPPADVANLLASFVLNGDLYDLTLSWVIPNENVGDVVEQLVYKSQDDGSSYSVEASLDPEATEHEINGLEPGEYWFKVTQVDGAGNESEGTIKKVILSETGPGLAGLAIVSLALGRRFGRRKRD